MNLISLTIFSSCYLKYRIKCDNMLQLLWGISYLIHRGFLFKYYTLIALFVISALSKIVVRFKGEDFIFLWLLTNISSDVLWTATWIRSLASVSCWCICADQQQHGKYWIRAKYLTIWSERFGAESERNDSTKRVNSSHILHWRWW